MADSSTSPNAVPGSLTPVNQNQAKPVSSSPWDEELPEPAPQKQPVVGTLDAEKGNNPVGNPKPAAFAVPADIDKNISPEVVQPNSFPNAIADAKPSQAQSQPPAQSSDKPTEPLFTYGIDFAGSTPKPIVAEETTPPVPAKPPVAPQISNPSVPSKSGVSSLINDIRPASLGGQSILPNKGSVGTVKPMTNQPPNRPNPNTPVPDNPAPPQNQVAVSKVPKMSIWPFGRKQEEKLGGEPLKKIAEVQNKPIPAADGADLMDPERPPDRSKVFGYVATGFAVLALTIFLTEFGILSIGLEKVYGAVGLENLWGGLPLKSDKALARSFITMQDHPDFKIKGSLDLTIDKTKDSDITTPLTLSYVPNYESIIKATLAVADTSSDWSATDWAVDGTTSSDTSGISDSTTSDSTSSDSAASTPAASSSDATSSQTDQQSYQSYQSLGASTKDIEATFDGFIGQTGNELKFVVNKAVGSDKIDLKNLDTKLWVRSDSLVFGGNSDSTKWLENTISSLTGKSLSREFLSAPDNGLSVKGSRKSNEKVGGIRCYNYEISEITLGNSLSFLGIKSDTVQSITGNAWIGVRDKLLHKIDLKITLAPSYPITKLTLSASLYDYDLINNYAKVAVNDIYQPGSTDAESITSTTSTDTPAAISGTGSTTETGDTKRKSDLVLIQQALELYKGYYYSYPTAPVLVKLNTANNIIEKLMVPGYISTLPKDSKDAEGWFYGYKSDGTSYTLSARLENAADPMAVSTSGLSLYFLKNQ